MSTVRKFTRDDPCTKVHLWNCFRGKDGFGPVPVVEAQAEIGANAPKYLLREGYAVLRGAQNVDLYVLTPIGERWLTHGLRRHLEIHPGEAQNLKYPLPGRASSPTARPSVVRVRPVLRRK